MTQEEFDLEFPPGSQKRQEEIWRLEKESTPEIAPEPDDGKVPESVWRGNA
jgi:hypothetical protein